MLAPKLPSGFGPYTLVQRLAQGGMAEVFLARQRSSGGSERNLVIKRILPHLAEDQEFITMFQQEARLAMQLSHPNIVHTYDFGREGDTFYIALEYVDGPSLQTLIKHSRKPVPKAIAVRIACGVAAGLAYAHNSTDEEGHHLGLVHRDVSPPNILVARDGSVKLVDFGIAKALHRTPGTHSTTLKGKFAYMAPEQFDGEVTQRVDIYALGVCLYEMLSGEPLFRQKTVAELIRAVCASEMDPLCTRAPWVPEPLEAIVMRALHRDPEQRYQSAETLLLVLERFLTQQGLVASPMLVGEWVRDTLSQPAAKRKTPTLDDPPPAPGGRESDPFDITAVRRQPAEPASAPRPLDADVTPRASMRPPRDTMPQDFIVLSSRSASDPGDEPEEDGPPDPGGEVERTPVELTEPLSAAQVRPPQPVKPTVGPGRTPLPPERPRQRTPAPAAPAEFEKTTSPRTAAIEPDTALGPLEQAAARLATPLAKKPSAARMAAAAAPIAKTPRAPVVFDEDKTIADPEARPPEPLAKGPDDTERTLSLPPEKKPGAADAGSEAVALLARKFATIPDPTEPAVPAFPVRPAQAAKAPAPTREPPRPVAKPVPLAVPARPRPVSPPPSSAAPAEPEPRGRETKPAPPPRTGPMEAAPAITTPLPRVSPPQAPPIFTAKPVAAEALAPGPPAVVTPAARHPTEPLGTLDLGPPLGPPSRVEDAEDTNETLLRVPDPVAELLRRAPAAEALAPPPIRPAAAPVIDAPAPIAPAPDAPPMPTPPPAAPAAPGIFGAIAPAGPPTPRGRLEIPAELLQHTPQASDSLTDVVTSAAFPMPVDLETEATRVKPDSEENEATRIKLGADLGVSTVGPTEALPAARVSEPMSMGPTVVLADASARDPVFSAAPAEAHIVTEQVLKPSTIVSPGGRSMAGIALAVIAVVLVAGGLGLYLATARTSGDTVAQNDPPPAPPGAPTGDPPVPLPGVGNPLSPQALPGVATPGLPQAGPAQPVPVPGPADPAPPQQTPAPPPQANPQQQTPAPPPQANPQQQTPAQPHVAQHPPTPRDPAPRDPRPRDPAPRDPRPRNPVIRDPPAPRDPAPTGAAHLFINTEPWSHVIVGGRDVGTTPVANIDVPAGRVRLTLIDPDGHRFVRTLRVEPGEQKRVFFQLQ